MSLRETSVPSNCSTASRAKAFPALERLGTPRLVERLEPASAIGETTPPKPVFNYINHKFTTAGEKPGSRVRPDVPYGIHRLVFAASVFTDSAVCYSFTPPKERGRLIGVWDELVGGVLNRPGWLGKPVDAAIRVATEGDNLLENADRFRVGARRGTRLRREGSCFVVTSADNEEGGSDTGQLRARLENVPCNGPDLFVRIRAKGEPLKGHPSEMARLMEVGIAPPEGLLTVGERPVTGMALRGKPETQLASNSGARVVPRRIEIGGAVKRGFDVHPPYKEGVGYTFWSREVTIPREGRLQFSTGMGERSPERSDGVWFRVYVSNAETDKPVVDGTRIFEHVQKAHRWQDHEVSLKKWQGERVRLSFVADCGPNDNSTTDHAKWGEPVVVGNDEKTNRTQPRTFMSWLGPEAFDSTFYFDAIRDNSVDLDIGVEGGTPVVIESIDVYSAPDVIYREFEHGLVVSNPSPRLIRFDLAKRFPAERFRRIQGTAEQDSRFNNGEPVGTVLELGPKDAVFLRRE